MHQSEHGLSAVLRLRNEDIYSVTGPSPYTETTDPLPAYAGLHRSPAGWWGIVVHRPRGIHPQDAVQHFEREPTPVIWLGQRSTIGLYLLPHSQKVISASINVEDVEAMKRIIAEERGFEFAESRFYRRRLPAGVRYLPGQQLQLWFAL